MGISVWFCRKCSCDTTIIYCNGGNDIVLILFIWIYRMCLVRSAMSGFCQQCQVFWQLTSRSCRHIVTHHPLSSVNLRTTQDWRNPKTEQQNIPRALSSKERFLSHHAYRVLITHPLFVIIFGSSVNLAASVEFVIRRIVCSFFWWCKKIKKDFVQCATSTSDFENVSWPTASHHESHGWEYHERY